jgi:SMI1-KNR4 cell-wall
MTPLELLVSYGIRPATGNLSVDDLEAALGLSVPLPYREVLAKGGGGFAVDTYYFDPVEETSVQLGWFLNAEESLQAKRDLEGTIENWMLPIANDGGDNMLCIAVSGPYLGQIFFHDHGVASLNPLSSDAPTSAYLVADSFEALANSITQP